jgi:hypothetical protein
MVNIHDIKEIKDIEIVKLEENDKESCLELDKEIDTNTITSNETMSPIVENNTDDNSNDIVDNNNDIGDNNNSTDDSNHSMNSSSNSARTDDDDDYEDEVVVVINNSDVEGVENNTTKNNGERKVDIEDKDNAVDNNEDNDNESNSTSVDKLISTSKEVLAAYGICIISSTPLVSTLKCALSDLITNATQITENSENCSHKATFYDKIKPEILLDKYKELEINLNKTNVFDNKDKKLDYAIDIDVKCILESISPRSLVTLLFASLLECRIAIISSQVSTPTILGEWIRHMLSPLDIFCNLYIPVVPSKFNVKDILECPTPYYLGVNRNSISDFNNINENVLLFDIDNDICKIPHSLQQCMGKGYKRLTGSIFKLLRQSLHSCDDIYPTTNKDNINKELKVIMNLFINPLLKSAIKCSLLFEDGQVSKYY